MAWQAATCKEEQGRGEAESHAGQNGCSFELLFHTCSEPWVGPTVDLIAICQPGPLPASGSLQLLMPLPCATAVKHAEPDYARKLALVPDDAFFPAGVRSSGMWFLNHQLRHQLATS